MLLTRKDEEWQSANNKNENSISAWKKKYEDIKEQFDDGELCILQWCSVDPTVPGWRATGLSNMPSSNTIATEK